MTHGLGPSEDPRFKHRRVDWDVRGIIALIVTVGVFGIASLQVLTDHPDGATIPAWAAGLVTGVNVFYFATRGNGNGSRKNGNGRG